MKAILLAAGRGTRLEPLTNDIPKCMVPVDGVPLIDRMIDHLAAVDIDQVVVVTGHLSDVLDRHLAASSRPLARGAVRVFNERYHDWGNFYSLLVARDAVAGDSFIKLDADVLLDDSILPALLAAAGPAVLTIDKRDDLGAEEMKARVNENGRIVELNKRMDPAVAIGESIGVERIDAGIAPAVFDELEKMIAAGETDDYYERAYERLMAKGVEFDHADITSANWYEIDDHADLERAHEIARRQG